MYRQGASIPTEARAVLNGDEVNGETIIEAGDILTFDVPTGTKG
jgi:hypothetical protein